MQQFSNSALCQAKCLYALMQEMQANGGSINSKDIADIVPRRVELNEWDKEILPTNNVPRWLNHTMFCSIAYSYAGMFVKKRGTWYITPEGEEALRRSAIDVWQQCGDKYSQREDNSQSENECNIDKTSESQIKIGIEELEARAIEEIRAFIIKKNPYEFQDMVAALLRAMGYHTPFVAPRGKDGGVDIIAYVDAIGAQTPRIKVQVKHYPENPIAANYIRSLTGVLRDGDVGLFVTSGRYSADAKLEARNSPRFVKLIDGDEFIELWQSYFDKMADDDKNMMPLYRISFLGNN